MQRDRNAGNSDKTLDWTDLPNPGSDEAIAAGCTCPILDNAHGAGYLGQAGVFVFTQGCLVHTVYKTLDAPGLL
jgi:hypothetical protein